jgi:hypothetical protein
MTQNTAASSRSTLALLANVGARSATVRAAAAAEVERQKQMVHTELRERFG